MKDIQPFLLFKRLPARLLLTCCFSPPPHRRLPPRRIAASLQPFADSLPLPPCRRAASEPPCCPIAASVPLRRLCSALGSPIPPPHATTPRPLVSSAASLPHRSASPLGLAFSQPSFVIAASEKTFLACGPRAASTEHRHRLNGYTAYCTGHALDVSAYRHRHRHRL